MLATKTLSQLDSKQKTLIKIAINITNRPGVTESRPILRLQIKGYQIWRDCHDVAVVNIKTQKLVVFGTVTPQLERENIVGKDLWKSIHHYYGDFGPVIERDEIDSAWQFLRPLDPTIQRLHQTLPRKQQDFSIEIAPQTSLNQSSKIEKMPSILYHVRSFFRPQLHAERAAASI